MIIFVVYSYILIYHLMKLDFLNMEFALNMKYRPPDKSAYWKTIFFIFHPKHMLWVLKRTTLRQFF